MKTFLFIDGTNLYAAQYELFGPDRYLHFPTFIKEIERGTQIEFDCLFFYASYSPRPKRLTKKVKQYLTNEAMFYRSVRVTQKLTFFRGYRSPTSGKEKEVDVNLAVDIVHLAHLQKYKNLYLFSGDADFMHALEITKKLKCHISILAIENRIPNRFSYLFRTHVFSFGGKQPRVHPHQKITTINLEKFLSDLVKG